LEFALACDYRLVLDKPATQLGLPEVRLGLLPGWGGTQRLPGVVGLRRALEVILEGRRLGARDALRWGLADVAPAGEAELRSQLAFLGVRAIQQGKRAQSSLPNGSTGTRRTGLPLRTWGQWALESTPLGRGLICGAAASSARASWARASPSWPPCGARRSPCARSARPPSTRAWAASGRCSTRPFRRAC